jgi:hypothetical protein
MWEPQCLTNLWASTACYRNSFCLTVHHCLWVCDVRPVIGLLPWSIVPIFLSYSHADCFLSSASTDFEQVIHVFLVNKHIYILRFCVVCWMRDFTCTGVSALPVEAVALFHCSLEMLSSQWRWCSSICWNIATASTYDMTKPWKLKLCLYMFCWYHLPCTSWYSTFLQPVPTLKCGL